MTLREQNSMIVASARSRQCLAMWSQSGSPDIRHGYYPLRDSVTHRRCDSPFSTAGWLISGQNGELSYGRPRAENLLALGLLNAKPHIVAATSGPAGPRGRRSKGEKRERKESGPLVAACLERICIRTAHTRHVGTRLTHAEPAPKRHNGVAMGPRNGARTEAPQCSVQRGRTSEITRESRLYADRRGAGHACSSAWRPPAPDESPMRSARGPFCR